MSDDHLCDNFQMLVDAVSALKSKALSKSLHHLTSFDVHCKTTEVVITQCHFVLTVSRGVSLAVTRQSTSNSQMRPNKCSVFRIWQQIDVDDVQFGFMKDKGTTDAIFIVRQMQEKFRTKGKKLYFDFVDMEKALAFDRAPREMTRWAMRKLGVEEWLVSAVGGMVTTRLL